MRRANWVLIAIALCFVTVSPALAGSDEPIQGYIAGGYSQPTGKADDFLEGGWNISGGIIWRPAPAQRPFGVRFDAGYNEWNAKQALLDYGAVDQLRTDGGWGSMFSLTVDAMWNFGHPGGVNGYVGLGLGGYRRYVALTQTVVQGGYYCDPWWGWCYPGLVAGDVVTADDKVTKFGYNAALGVTFPVGTGEMFVEARYHYMITSTATEYVPILIGYRF